MPPCKPAVGHKKGEDPLNSQVGTRNALCAAGACRNVRLETTSSGATAWELSLRRGRQGLMYVHGNMEIAPILPAMLWSKLPLF